MKKFGLAKGKIEGEKIGEKRNKIETAKRLLELSIDTDTILKATGLTQKELDKILKN